MCAFPTMETTKSLVSEIVGRLLTNSSGDFADLVHHVGVLLGKQRLRAVGHRFFWLVVDFDVNAVSACGDAGEGAGGD